MQVKLEEKISFIIKSKDSLSIALDFEPARFFETVEEEDEFEKGSSRMEKVFDDTKKILDFE